MTPVPLFILASFYTIGEFYSSRPHAYEQTQPQFMILPSFPVLATLVACLFITLASEVNYLSILVLTSI